MRDRLIELREAAALTQEDLAEQINVSAKSVYRWEAGERRPQMKYRRKLAQRYGVSLTIIHQALADRLNGHTVPSHLTHFASLEQGATELRTWETLAINGLLQTVDYARAVERSGIPEQPDDEIERRVELRLARQQALHRQPAPLRLHALLDASVLLRVTGGRQVMAAQLAHLREMSELPNVEIRVTPLDGRVFAGPGTFQVISGEAMVPYIACTENLAGVQYLETPSVVSAYAELFEHLWGTSDALDEVQLLDS